MMQPKEIAAMGLQIAQKKGAQSAAVSYNRSRNVSIDWRDGALEKVEDGTTQSLSFELYVDGRYSVVSTSDLRKESLATFVESAVATTRVLAEDKDRALPDPKYYQGLIEKDLHLMDPQQASISPQLKRDLARETEAAARSVKDNQHILSVSSQFSDSLDETFRLHSNGFEGYQAGTTFFLSASVSVHDKDGKPEEFAYAGGRYFKTLPNPKTIGIEAAERTLARRGSSKGASGKYTMIVEPRVAGRLLAMMRGPLSGRSLQQKQSYLEGKMGQSIASSLLTITDNPHRPSGFGSRLFDNEGMTAKALPIIEKGVLRNYYLDTYYARKMELQPTTGSTSNVELALGDKDKNQWINTVKDGILVTSFLGGNSNGLTGDFSLGIQGYMIRNGQIAEPIGEMNLSGNLLPFFQNLIGVGNDPFLYSSLLAPTLVFDQVEIAGT
ncbi:MAG: TldD/PmbA family protein [Acidobacteria bacterium]|nr:TldD/PmbA family protein [Acidobacteriota bacterium]MCB9396719.1 TldD/PmbA family protein [Acidobacteriota bacterium]